MEKTELEMKKQILRFDNLSRILNDELVNSEVWGIYGLIGNPSATIEHIVKLEGDRADFIADEYKDLKKSNLKLADSLVKNEKEHFDQQIRLLHEINEGSIFSDGVKNMATKGLIELENIRSDFISALTDSSQEGESKASPPKSKPKGRH